MKLGSYVGHVMGPMHMQGEAIGSYVGHVMAQVNMEGEAIYSPYVGHVIAQVNMEFEARPIRRSCHGSCEHGG